MTTRRPPYRIALALAAVLAVPMLLDTIGMLRGKWEYPPLRRGGNDMAAAVEAAGSRNRFLNAYVGLAAREVAGGAPRRVVMPRDLGLLSDRPPDVFAGVPQPALNARLMAPMLAGAGESDDYDPRLTDVQMRRLLGAGGEVRELPWGVKALMPEPDGTSRDVVLFSDARQQTIVAAPLALAEEAGVR